MASAGKVELSDGSDVHVGVDRAREVHRYARLLGGTGIEQEVTLASALCDADEIDEAMLRLARCERAVTKLDVQRNVHLRVTRMTIGYQSGDWDVVLADAEAILALRTNGPFAPSVAQAGAIAALILLARKDHAGVERWRAVSRAVSRAGSPRGANRAAELYEALAAVLVAEQHGLTRAAAAAYDALFHTEADAPLTQLWLAPDYVRVALAAGDVQGAASALRSLEPLAMRVDTPSARAVLGLCRGMLAAHRGSADALELLRGAYRATDTIRRVPLRRSIAMVFARQLEVEGHGPKARPVQADVAWLSGELGISDVVVDHGQPVSTAPPPVLLARLTPTQARVLALVAAGLGNVRIAERMGISKRTVESHMAALYLKAGVADRVELASRAGALTP
jgi:DNA-binding CsgD family transcriptional regulator